MSWGGWRGARIGAGRAAADRAGVAGCRRRGFREFRGVACWQRLCCLLAGVGYGLCPGCESALRKEPIEGGLCGIPALAGGLVRRATGPRDVFSLLHFSPPGTPASPSATAVGGAVIPAGNRHSSELGTNLTRGFRLATIHTHNGTHNRRRSSLVGVKRPERESPARIASHPITGRHSGVSVRGFSHTGKRGGAMAIG